MELSQTAPIVLIWFIHVSFNNKKCKVHIFIWTPKEFHRLETDNILIQSLTSDEFYQPNHDCYLFLLTSVQFKFVRFFGNSRSKIHVAQSQMNRAHKASTQKQTEANSTDIIHDAHIIKQFLCHSLSITISRHRWLFGRIVWFDKRVCHNSHSSASLATHVLCNFHFDTSVG